jgi:hypothetical protein
MVGTHAHDLGARGLELGDGPLEAEQFLGSGAGERLDEREDDDGALRGQVGELDLLAAVKSGAFGPPSRAATGDVRTRPVSSRAAVTSVIVARRIAVSFRKFA